MASLIHLSQVEQAPSEKIYELALSLTPNKILSNVDQFHSIAPLKQVKPVFKPRRSFVLVFISICIITLAIALDAIFLSIALPIITERLKETTIQSFWSGTSFFVAFGVFQLVISSLSHEFGRKHVCDFKILLWISILTLCKLVFASALFFAVESFVAALATNFNMMWVFFSALFLNPADLLRLVERSIQDIGGEGILTFGEILITDPVPLSV